MNIELAKLLVKIVEDAGHECDLREDYSGRGMFGKTTAGIVVDSVPQLLADVLRWVSGNIGRYQTEGDEVDGAGIDEWMGGEIPDVSDFQIDNMGRSIILY